MSNTAFRCGISTSLRLVSAPQVKKMMESTALAALGDRLRRLTDSAHPAVALTRADPAGGERGDVVRVRCQQQLGGLLYARQQVRIAHQIRDPQLRESGLTRAEELPGSAQLEVAARDLVCRLLLEKKKQYADKKSTAGIRRASNRALECT